MEKFEKKQKISGFKEGDTVKDVFVVKFKKGILPYKNGYSFELTLSDNSNKNIDYKYWGNTEEERIKTLYDSILPDSVIRIKGKISSYNGKLQFSSNEQDSIIILEKEQYNESDFIKPAKRDIETMHLELLKAISEIENPKIKKLLETIFSEKKLSTKFDNHPGAIEIHHDWKGGLLQHSLEVLAYCRQSWQLFPTIDKDLLTAGALLHDIGKLEELEVTSRIKGTKKGQLIGHLVLSTVFVSQKCDEIGLEEETKNKLLHLIVSHHGKNDFGSPKEPMFPEATALYYADELSSKLAEIIEFSQDARLGTEDDFMFHKRSQKNILIR